LQSTWEERKHFNAKTDLGERKMLKSELMKEEEEKK